MTGEYTFDSPEWRNISTEAKNFIRKMLVFNPAKRISCKEAIEDAWFKKYCAPTTVEIPLIESALLNMSRFRVILLFPHIEKKQIIF